MKHYCQKPHKLPRTHHDHQLTHYFLEVPLSIRKVTVVVLFGSPTSPTMRLSAALTDLSALVPHEHQATEMEFYEPHTFSMTERH